MFIGKQASEHTFQLIKSVNRRSFTPLLYVIALHKQELFFVHNQVFGHLYHKKKALFSFLTPKKDGEEVLILGFALGKREAQELIRDMVEEVYAKTGAFDYGAYFWALQEEE